MYEARVERPKGPLDACSCVLPRVQAFQIRTLASPNGLGHRRLVRIFEPKNRLGNEVCNITIDFGIE